MFVDIALADHQRVLVFAEVALRRADSIVSRTRGGRIRGRLGLILREQRGRRSDHRRQCKHRGALKPKTLHGGGLLLLDD